MTYRRFADNCYAVTIGRRRGPIGNSRVTALKRFRKSGLITPSWRHGR